MIGHRPIGEVFGLSLRGQRQLRGGFAHLVLNPQDPRKIAAFAGDRRPNRRRGIEPPIGMRVGLDNGVETRRAQRARSNACHA